MSADDEVVVGAMADLLDRTAARAAAAFAEWPSVAVGAEGFLDDGGFPDSPPVGIRLLAQVRDGTARNFERGCVRRREARCIVGAKNSRKEAVIQINVLCSDGL